MFASADLFSNEDRTAEERILANSNSHNDMDPPIPIKFHKGPMGIPPKIVERGAKKSKTTEVNVDHLLYGDDIVEKEDEGGENGGNIDEEEEIDPKILQARKRAALRNKYLKKQSLNRVTLPNTIEAHEHAHQAKKKREDNISNKSDEESKEETTETTEIPRDNTSYLALYSQIDSRSNTFEVHPEPLRSMPKVLTTTQGERLALSDTKESDARLKEELALKPVPVIKEAMAQYIMKEGKLGGGGASSMQNKEVVQTPDILIPPNQRPMLRNSMDLREEEVDTAILEGSVEGQIELSYGSPRDNEEVEEEGMRVGIEQRGLVYEPGQQFLEELVNPEVSKERKQALLTV